VVFAEDSTVEVIALQRLDEGIKAGDKKAEMYEAVNEKGEPVKYMVKFPGLTADDMFALNRTRVQAPCHRGDPLTRRKVEHRRSKGATCGIPCGDHLVSHAGIEKRVGWLTGRQPGGFLRLS
jgi:hypothetical protein